MIRRHGKQFACHAFSTLRTAEESSSGELWRHFYLSVFLIDVRDASGDIIHFQLDDRLVKQELITARLTIKKRNFHKLDMTKKRILRCKDCKLYNKKEGVCMVVVVAAGEKMELMTKPEDLCMWEKMGIGVQQIRAWSDGKNGYIES